MIGLRLNLSFFRRRQINTGAPPAVDFAIAQAGSSVNFIALAGQTTDVLLQAGR